MYHYRYTAFGLGIHSVLPLPELVAAPDREADVVVQWGRFHRDRSNKEQKGSSFTIMDGRARLFWDHVGSFEIREGRKIIIDPIPGVEEQVLRLPLLGAVIAILLHQRGVLVLHGSAVQMNGQAVAFLGNKGTGKSTLAAALFAQDHQLVADDLTAVQDGDFRTFRVLSAFPQFKLWPEAVTHALGDNVEALPRVHSQTEKRACRIDERFHEESALLRHIYILEAGATLRVELLKTQAAMIELIRNSFVVRFGSQFVQNGGGQQHFKQCAQLVRNIPVYRMTYPHSILALPTVVEFVTTHTVGKSLRA